MPDSVTVRYELNPIYSLSPPVFRLPPESRQVEVAAAVKMTLMMENFRDFTAGPDPFGRTWHILFKYLQTGISIRHSDSVDVRFVLDNGEEQIQKTVVIPHAEIRAFAQSSGRTISDTWCSRLAACHLRRVIETAEDFEKDYITVTPKEIEEYDSAIKKWEAEWVSKHAA